MANQLAINIKSMSLEKSTTKDKKFCKTWPDAKIGLTALQAIIKNSFVKVIIGIVIASGDALAIEKKCVVEETDE